MNGKAAGLSRPMPTIVQGNSLGRSRRNPRGTAKLQSSTLAENQVTQTKGYEPAKRKTPYRSSGDATLERAARASCHTANQSIATTCETMDFFIKKTTKAAT